MLAAGTCLARYHAAMDLQNHRIGIDCQFSLKGGGQQEWQRTDRTYIEGMKDPIEVRLPGGDHFFVVLRMDEPGE